MRKSNFQPKLATQIIREECENSDVVDISPRLSLSEGTLTRITNLIDVARRLIESPQHRQDTVTVAIGPANVRACGYEVGNCYANSSSALGYPGAPLRRIKITLYAVAPLWPIGSTNTFLASTCLHRIELVSHERKICATSSRMFRRP